MKKIFMIVSTLSLSYSVFAQEVETREVLVRCASAVTIATHTMKSVRNEMCYTCNNDICNNDTCSSGIQKEYRPFTVQGNTLRIRSHYQAASKETTGQEKNLYQHHAISLRESTKRVDLKPEIKMCESSVGARVRYTITEYDSDDHDADHEDKIADGCTIL